MAYAPRIPGEKLASRPSGNIHTHTHTHTARFSIKKSPLPPYLILLQVSLP